VKKGVGGGGGGGGGGEVDGERSYSVIRSTEWLLL